ncbi:HDIG domain-containing protein [Pseudobutyrivibrio sp. UC1225]|uniref:HD-GYP domain-containing protein n=1 Tax=Pseudobutyrivibrio sp. UC1225 TaxID=1798185 RepID=UPI0008EB3718|nr:HD-GYP domain-containing protein [Pseudobutyrivibrio sp. UC1225]SFO07941.1 HDIG domain-containing protein [Pseudobutyrivibrio sp. UC1225]
MTTLTVDKLEPNMIVSEPVVTKRGQTIVKAGEKLTPQMIAKLTFYKIESATVEDIEEEAPVEEVPEPVQEETPEPKKTKPAQKEKKKEVDLAHPKETVKQSYTQIPYTQRLKASPTFQKFQSDYAINLAFLQKNFDDILAGATCSTDEMLKNCESLFKSKTTIELLNMLGNMRNLEDPVYSHSLNVGLISRVIGKWLKLPLEDVNLLTLAGLLHDIGKTQIPKEILNKPDKLTDEEFATMKTHTTLGKKVLNGKGFDPRILYAALQHHERCDGSGYPRGLEEDEIDDFACIVAIADVYDAMTSARAHRDPLCSFQVISEFEREGLHKFKTKYILTFLEHIANTYNNSRVMLNDAKTGRVVYINKSSLSRPVVQLDSGEIINLADSAYSNIFIKSIL